MAEIDSLDEMNILSVSFSQSLLQNLKSGPLPLSAVETGPWFSEDEIIKIGQQVPGLAVHFHSSNLLMSGRRAKTAVEAIKRYHLLTQSPWDTPHIDLLPPGYYPLYQRYKKTLPLPGERLLVNRCIGRVRLLQKSLDLPVVLENLPMLPGGPYQFQSDPRIIHTILEQTGCSMLLDTGHARISAALRGWKIEDYLRELPLHKVVHVHVSGPRERNGYLMDAHEPLQEVDYEILQWVLERTQPGVLTLEYFRDPDALRQQIERLAGMISTSG